ncbi:MAG: hydrolase [Ignavibacteriae bacterium]|nr:hydrolase [Ignavibacteriota bacterium]
MKQETKNKLKTSYRVKLLLLLLTIGLIVFMFPKGEALESEVNVGSIWIQEDLIASTTFEILKSKEQYDREVQRALQNVNPVFILDEKVIDSSLDSIRSYNKVIREIIDKDIYQSDEINDFRQTFLSPQAYETLKNIRIKENSLTASQSLNLNDFFRISSDIILAVERRGYLNQLYENISKDTIALREGKFEKLVSKSNYYDSNLLNDFIEDYLSQLGVSNELSNAVKEYVYRFVAPNILYSPELTNAAVELAKNKVTRNVGIVNENERIVAKHDRITPEIKLKIDSYRIAKGTEIGIWGRISQTIGKFLHILVIFTLFIIYLYLFRKRIFNDNYKLLLISLIILFISFLTYLVHQINVKAPVEMLILVPVLSMLFTIVFDSRLGFYGTIVIALIAGGLRGNDYAFAVMNIVAGGLAAYTVRDIKNRNQIFRSFLFILIGYLTSIIAFGFERFAPIDQMLVTSAFAASNALISPVLTYGLIIFIERIFKITTDLTLLELTDFNNPMLKELSKNAPGTFSHSMTIGSLVESASEAIGANSTLARVGAYYHDIGKASSPDSFVENQMGSANLHENLKPEESAKIIIGHVLKGIETAEKYKLPQEVINFIPMHHGTMVVSFFYEKAKELYGKENVDISNFRYPGPKPNTKETAILMLADACESTVRAMNEPDQQKIENVINNLFKIRLDDGQLDEAPLTLSDLTKIKKEFLNILVSQHHKRIRYPKQDEMENEASADK